MKRKKRHALTLIEIMLVIVVIGIVSGALAFNMRGALDRGREFKTRQAQEKIDAILSMAAAENSPNFVEERWTLYVKNSPLIKLKDKNSQIVDAWGNAFEVEYDPIEKKFLVTSDKIDADGNIL